MKLLQKIIGNVKKIIHFIKIYVIMVMNYEN